MTTQISINILYGGAYVSDDDCMRAKRAAMAVIAAAGTTVDTAFAEFCRQWEQFDDYDKLTGLARVWIDAEQAADLALTDGWTHPDGAACAIGGGNAEPTDPLHEGKVP